MCHYETHAIETERGSINVYFEKQSKLYCLLHTANNILQAHVYSPDDFKDAESMLDYAAVGDTTLSGDQGDTTGRSHTDEISKKGCTAEDGNRGNRQPPHVRAKEALNCNNVLTYIKRGVHYFGNFNINILYLFMNKHNIELHWVDNKEIFRKINDSRGSACSPLFDDSQLNDKKLIAFVVNIVRVNLFDFYHHRHFYAIRKISGVPLFQNWRSAVCGVARCAQMFSYPHEYTFICSSGFNTIFWHSYIFAPPSPFHPTTGMWFQLDSSLSKPVLLPTNEDVRNMRERTGMPTNASTRRIYAW